MEKKWWLFVLGLFAVLAVLSIINITGFAVVLDSDTGSEEKITFDDNRNDILKENPSDNPVISFPNQGPVGNQPGSSDPTPLSLNNTIPDVHAECVQEQCVIIEGVGENQCRNETDCFLPAVCGDGVCEVNEEDTVTCLADCQAPTGTLDNEGDESDQLESGNEENGAGTNPPNPALGEQGSMSDEDFEAYIANSYRTCTVNFQMCVRLPKVTGNERDLCDDAAACLSIKERFDHTLEPIQLSPGENRITSFLSRFLGFFSD